MTVARSVAIRIRNGLEDARTRVTHQPPRRVRSAISPLWLDFTKSGRDQVSFLQELGGLTPESRVLDIGCGVGRIAVPLTAYLGPKGSYEGFDVLEYVVEWCQRNISRRHPSFRFTHADVRTSTGHDRGVSGADYVFPYDDDSFDLAYAGSLFTHLAPDDAANYLAQTQRVLKPGGVLVGSWNMYNSATEERLAGRSLERAWPYARDQHRLKESEAPESNVAYDEIWLRAQYSKAGLDILEPVRPDATYSPLRVPRGVEAAHLWYTGTVIAMAT